MRRWALLLVLAACDDQTVIDMPQGRPQFVDMAATAGLRDPVVAGEAGQKRHILEANTGGAALFDYDGDGDVDAFLVNGWRFGLNRHAPDAPTSRLYRNDGAGRFTDVTQSAGVGHKGWGMGCAAWDVDGDGWTDLSVTAAGQDVLYHNDGDGTFSENQDAQFGSSGWSTGIGAADYDGDGDVDVYVASYVDLGPDPAVTRPDSFALCTWRGVTAFCGPAGLPGAVDLLQLMDGDGLYRDASQQLRSRPAYYGLGVLAGDFDGDGDADIYVADDSTPNLLYRNDGGLFVDIAAAAGVAVSLDGRQQAGMGIAAADIDGDGGIDFAVTNFSHDHVSLYASQGDSVGTGRWEDLSYAHDVGRHTLSTLGWGAGLVDFDNDADIDLFVANGHVYPAVGDAGIGTSYKQLNQLFDNDGGVLRDVGERSGPGLQVVESSRGAAFGDVDDDGDVDILVVNLDAPPSLLRNDGGNRLAWLSISLVGPATNRSAIGARVEVTAAGRSQWRELRAGTGYLSQDGHRLHFGLGTASTATVGVRWPDGLWQEAGEVAVRQRLRLERPTSPAH